MLDEFFDDEYGEQLKPKVKQQEIEIKSAKKKTMFDVMSTVVNKRFMPTEEELKLLNSFILVRYISNDSFGINIANVINTYHKMPIKAQYLYARFALKDKINYINYPKKKEQPNKEIIEIICKEYKCSDNIAMDYIERLPKEILDSIITKHTAHGIQGKVKKTRKKK